MAFWLWVVAAVLIGLLVLALISQIQVRVRYSRSGMLDQAALVVHALYGAFRYQKEFPALTVRAVTKAVQSPNSGGKSGLLKRMKPFRPLILQTLKKVECTRYRLDLRIGTGDAPATAIASGLLWTLYGSALAIAGHFITLKAKPHGGVVPNYDAKEFSVVWEADFGIRLGVLMWSAMKLGMQMLRIRKPVLSGGNRLAGPESA